MESERELRILGDPKTGVEFLTWSLGERGSVGNSPSPGKSAGLRDPWLEIGRVAYVSAGVPLAVAVRRGEVEKSVEWSLGEPKGRVRNSHPSVWHCCTESPTYGASYILTSPNRDVSDPSVTPLCGYVCHSEGDA